MNVPTFEHVNDKRVKTALLAWIELKLAKRYQHTAEKIRYNALPKHKRPKWDGILLNLNIRLFNARSAYNSAMKRLSKIQTELFSKEATSVHI